MYYSIPSFLFIGNMKAFGLGLLVYLIRYLAFADKNDCKIKSEVVHEWVTVDFLWDNETQKQEALDSGLYIPEVSLLMFYSKAKP